MKPIAKLALGLDTYTEVPKELHRMAIASMTDREHRPKLENWILFNFCQAYNHDHSEKLEWCECAYPPAPDYRVFTQPETTPIPIEVTELLDPERKRDEEYRLASEEAERTGDYLDGSDLPDSSLAYERSLVECARKILKNKFSKHYPSGTWLLVYFNPTAFVDTLEFAVRVMQMALDSLEPPQRISQVWLLTNQSQIAQLRTPCVHPS